MDRYRIIREIGDGTCGNVFRAFNIETNEIVAVKKMKRKFYHWEECISLREVKALQKLNHPNIVELREVTMENHQLFFIFEHMDCNLYDLIKERNFPLSEEEIRKLVLQILQGLVYMHNNGYFHRDLKPENLLVTNGVVKIADFGLAREVCSSPPYTDYVSTRWYRAPEVLLQASAYTPSIDMWAVGAILAELFTLSPLFPGDSEMGQLYTICTVLGTPDHSVWPEGMNLPRSNSFQFFQYEPKNLWELIPNASLEAIDLIKQLCSWDPRRRPTAEQALQHPFFNVGKSAPRAPHDNSYSRMNESRAAPRLELDLWGFSTESDDLDLTLSLKPSSVSDLNKHIPEHREEENILYPGFGNPPVQPAEPDGEPIIGAGAHPAGQFLLTDRTPGAAITYQRACKALFRIRTPPGGFSFFIRVLDSNNKRWQQTDRKCTYIFVPRFPKPFHPGSSVEMFPLPPCSSEASTKNLWGRPS